MSVTGEHCSIPRADTQDDGSTSPLAPGGESWSTRKSRAKRIALLVIGWLFIALGLAGLVLPILQGVLLLASGLLILSKESKWVAARVDRLRQRHPRLDAAVESAEEHLHRWWTRLKRVFNR